MLPDFTQNRPNITRRRFVRDSALAVLSTAVMHRRAGASTASGPAQQALALNQDWLFGRLTATSPQLPATAKALTSVTLPHNVVPLSWKNWDPSAWEDVWLYQRRFRIPHEWFGKRIFVHFDRVMNAATPELNGTALSTHLGGFLPFDYEVTSLLHEGENLLTVKVDGRWLNVPPGGSPKGPQSIDYLLPSGITGSVRLYAVPAVFIKDVFAKPVSVLEPSPRLELLCSIDGTASTRFELHAKITDGESTISQSSKVIEADSAGGLVNLTLEGLRNVALWESTSPRLYDVTVTLSLRGQPVHEFATRIGFRDARFVGNGFFLNGRRVQIFGLNRHELYPYVGFAACARSLRRDAQLLRNTLNCNMVRCSHYPQSEDFLNACDELGLMVWEEIPGWQYIGDADWQALMLCDVEAMIRRDRNHPSIVIWGTRINESANDPELYKRATSLAKSLDDSRPTSGTMTPSSMQNWREAWHQDILAFDDYHATGPNEVGIAPPPSNVPYVIAEAVGQFDYASGKGFSSKYRRAGDAALQARQALLHAQAHDRAAAISHCAGVIAWCAFDYASLLNSYDAVKCPGIADVFRIPKLGSSFYLAQVDPHLRPVIEPSFYWDFGHETPSGPGEAAVIFSNCERLEVFLDNRKHAVLHPDRASFPHLRYPPFFADLRVDQQTTPELRIEGYVGNHLVIVRRFSPDRSLDRLVLQAEDGELHADGADSTRVVFGVADRFGVQRPFVNGDVRLHVTGPAVLVGDNPFSLLESGGSGAVWVRSVPGRSGRVEITASHSSFPSQTVHLEVMP